MSDKHTTFPPYPCKGGGFSSFSSMSIPSNMPRYQPEMAAPLPFDGSASIRQSEELLARPIRGVFKNSSSATKTRRLKVKRGDSNAKEKRTNKSTLNEIIETEIGEAELQEELEAEEKGAITPTRSVTTRSRTRNLSGNSRVPVGSRRRSQRRGGQDSGDDSEDEADRDSDEDFMS